MEFEDFLAKEIPEHRTLSKLEISRLKLCWICCQMQENQEKMKLIETFEMHFDRLDALASRLFNSEGLKRAFELGRKSVLEILPAAPKDAQA